jgi:hypothetical protein
MTPISAFLLYERLAVIAGKIAPVMFFQRSTNGYGKFN